MVYLAVFAMVLCGLVLLVSAVSKVRGKAAYAEFAASVPAFGIPARWTSLFAAATVTAEFVITALLLPATASVLFGSASGWWLALAGLVFAAGLFGVLTAAVWRAVARRTGAVCRCFGPARTVLAHRHVVRNALLLLVAVAGAIALAGASAMSTVDPVVAALSAVVGAVGAVAVVRFDDLAELFAGPIPDPRTPARK
ncbi:MauE/DoxX family redox-associated membrane protein [Amycolatopsis sp. lyj-112]|uniref:MauE/DoxX family redox-associated membrane protein n=1 Tax=Amycolatopsis sp. lyj-112 TaxID=2789288 RepID=UPI00397823D7